MEKLITYLIAVNLLLFLPLAYYRLFLSRQPKFQWNRIFLVGGIVAAMGLPLLKWDILPPALPTPVLRHSTALPAVQTEPALPVLKEIQPLSSTNSAPAAVATQASPSNATTAQEAASFSPWTIILLVYGLGVAISLAVLIWRNLIILRLIALGQRTRRQGFTLVTTTSGIGPASYFRYIFWNAAALPDAESQAVAIAHESCHARQLHTLDLLLVEILRAFCWMNPAIYGLRKDLRQTHEFLADQSALQVAGPDGIKRLLLLHQLGAQQFALANYFHSPIKARMKMLQKGSVLHSRLHYLLILPFTAIMVACSSLGHPMEGSGTSAVTSQASVKEEAAIPTAEMPALYSIEDMMIEAQLPLSQDGGEAKKGMVCLGRQPQVLNLDTTLTLDELENVANHPQLLNRERVWKAMGSPVDDKGVKIKGKILVKLLVDGTGHVVRHQYLEPGDAKLRDAVETHIHDLLFKPGLEEGKPSEWWVIMPFNFGMPGC